MRCRRRSENIIRTLGTPLNKATSTYDSSRSEKTLDRSTRAIAGHANNEMSTATITRLGLKKEEITMSRGRVGSVSTTSAIRIKGSSRFRIKPDATPVVVPMIVVSTAVKKPTNRVALLP